MPSKKKKLGKARLDKFYYLAKEQGYRARAAFKLVQLNRKYEFLEKSSHAILDLCAAPGSWMQVCAKHVPAGTLVVGVDLVPIKPIRGCTAIEGDITSQKTRGEVKRALNGKLCDVVLHDGSPNVGTAWAQDAYSQSELVLASLKMATDFLREGGAFITKVFRSGDFNSLIWVFNQLFQKVETTKPQASRSTSAEIYVVCLGYLFPKKIDPKLLDPRFVFKELEQPQKEVNIFAKKQPKNKEGYSGELHKPKGATVSEFVDAENPIAFLGTIAKLDWDDASKIYKEHKATTAEILALCMDLKVLGKFDFRKLLSWRDKLVKLKEKINPTPKEVKEDEEEDQEETSEQEEERIDAELEEAVSAKDKKEKRKLKKIAEKRKKIQHKIDLKMIIPGDQLDTPNEQNLFALSTIKQKSDLESIRMTENEDDDIYVTDSDEENANMNSYGATHLDDEEDYNKQLDADFEHQYKIYLEQKSKIDPSLKGKIKKPKIHDSLTLDDLPGARKRDSDGEEEETSNGVVEFSDDEDIEESERNPLVDPLDKESAVTKRTAMWFSNELFDMASAPERVLKTSKKQKLEQEQASKSTTTTTKQSQSNSKTGGVSQTSTLTTTNSSKKQKRQEEEEEIENEQDLDQEEEEEEIQTSNKKQKGNNGLARKTDASVVNDSANQAQLQLKLKQQKQKKLVHFDGDSDEESDSDEDDQSSEEERLDKDMTQDEKALALALGTLVVNKKKKLRDIEEDTFNRWVYGDEQDLPQWFKDDESEINRRDPPVPKPLLDEMKAKYNPINIRTPKKVAEAKARKKMKANKRMEKLKKTAQQIADNGEMGSIEKTRAIERLYKGNKNFDRPKRKFIVNQRGGGHQAKQKVDKKGGRTLTRIVDSRLKKDGRNGKIQAKRDKNKKRKSRK